MTVPRMSAADALALFDAPEPQDAPRAPCEPTTKGYVAYHPAMGVFIGLVPAALMGLDMEGHVALWSAVCDGHQHRAVLFDDPATALSLIAEGGVLGAEDMDAVEIYPTPSGHWRDLQAMGLDVHTMPYNGLTNSTSTTLH